MARMARRSAPCDAGESPAQHLEASTIGMPLLTPGEQAIRRSDSHPGTHRIKVRRRGVGPDED